MFLNLKNHPLRISAHFDYSLVLAYAFPPEILSPLLRPGLELDLYNGFAFAAVAMVKTKNLRPSFLPPVFGKNFFLSGYRLFTRLRTSTGKNLRGLQILRSDTDSAVMSFSGNLLTHYNYSFSKIRADRRDNRISIEIKTRDGGADLSLEADIQPGDIPVFQGSPFKDWIEARKFAGPMPFTFYSQEGSSTVTVVEGIRQSWNVRPASVDVKQIAFFQNSAYFGDDMKREKPILANAFIVENVDYSWKPGRQEKIIQ